MSRARCVAVLVTFFALMAAPAVSQAQSTFLINGSFDQSPDWAQPGSDEFNAIAATYGTSPMPWQWTRNSWTEILPPNYSGIVYGGLDLANFLNSLPPGDVNLISHSHGGNVVLMSQAWSNRPIRRYIQLATPINWDFGNWRYALAYYVAGRCQASSNADWKQFFGSSPYQQGNFYYYTYQSVCRSDRGVPGVDQRRLRFVLLVVHPVRFRCLGGGPMARLDEDRS